MASEPLPLNEPRPGLSPAERWRVWLRREQVRRNAALLMMSLPVLVWLLVFRYATLYGLLIAFKDYNGRLGIMGSPWAGFDNFRFLFTSPTILRVTLNTVGMNLLFIFTGMAASLLIAFLLHEIFESRLARIYQTLLFLPSFISVVIVSYFVFAFFSQDAGLVNRVLQQLGLAPVGWYSSPEAWPGILTLVRLWQGAGIGSAIYLAAMLGIEPALYEAAQLDGASRWQQFRRITLPLLAPVITVMLLLALSNIVEADFGLFYIVPRNQPALYPTTDVIDTYTYRALVSSPSVGRAAAIGLAQSLVGFVLVLGANLFVRRVDPDRALF